MNSIYEPGKYERTLYTLLGTQLIRTLLSDYLEDPKQDAVQTCECENGDVVKLYPIYRVEETLSRLGHTIAAETPDPAIALELIADAEESGRIPRVLVIRHWFVD